MAETGIGNISNIGSDIGGISSNISQAFSGKLGEIWAFLQSVLKLALAIVLIFILYKIIAGIIRAVLKAREKRIMRNLLSDLSDNVKQINQKMDILISRLGRPAEKETGEITKDSGKSEAKKEKIKKKK